MLFNIYMYTYFIFMFLNIIANRSTEENYHQKKKIGRGYHPPTSITNVELV